MNTILTFALLLVSSISMAGNQAIPQVPVTGVGSGDPLRPFQSGTVFTEAGGRAVVAPDVIAHGPSNSTTSWSLSIAADGGATVSVPACHQFIMKTSAVQSGTDWLAASEVSARDAELTTPFTFSHSSGPFVHDQGVFAAKTWYFHNPTAYAVTLVVSVAQ